MKAAKKSAGYRMMCFHLAKYQPFSLCEHVQVWSESHFYLSLHNSLPFNSYTASSASLWSSNSWEAKTTKSYFSLREKMIRTLWTAACCWATHHKAKSILQIDFPDPSVSFEELLHISLSGVRAQAADKDATSTHCHLGRRKNRRPGKYLTRIEMSIMFDFIIEIQSKQQKVNTLNMVLGNLFYFMQRIKKGVSH